MKDIVISSKTIKREFLVAFASICAAFCLNIYAVIHYDRPAMELVSMIGYVVIAGVAIYLLSCILRVAVYLIAALVKKVAFKDAR